MNVKEITNRGYELFGKGDMATFFNELIDDNCVYGPFQEKTTHYLGHMREKKQ